MFKLTLIAHHATIIILYDCISQVENKGNCNCNIRSSEIIRCYVAAVLSDTIFLVSLVISSKQTLTDQINLSCNRAISSDRYYGQAIQLLFSQTVPKIRAALGERRRDSTQCNPRFRLSPRRSSRCYAAYPIWNTF